MRTECVPFEAIPHTTKLFRDFLADAASVLEFYPHSSQFTPWMKPDAERIDFDAARRAAITAILERQNRKLGVSAQTLQNIERLRNGACALVTGQQVVLFGGPMLSVLKALTAIQLAERASTAGVDCVPVFWLATQDHDFAEVNHVDLLGGQPSALTRLQVIASGNPEASVSARPITKESLDSALAAATNLLGEESASLLRECYRPGESLGEGMGRLFARLFAEYGLILFDPSDPEVARLAAPLYQRAVAEAGAITEGLLARGKTLEDAGYHEQVKVTSGSTLLFAEQKGARTSIRRSNGGFAVGKQSVTPKALEARIAKEPEKFSANVLFRPVVQDFLLPTLAYVGGPAEVAYFAQVNVVYHHLAKHVTTVLARCSATLIDPRHARILPKMGISFEQVLQGPEALREHVARAHLPGELRQQFQETSSSFDASFQSLAGSLTKLDPTLSDAAQRSFSKMRYQLERLRGKAARAQLRRSAELVRKADEISLNLYPHHSLQERQIAAVSMIAKHGPELLRTLHQNLNPECTAHQLLYL